MKFARYALLFSLLLALFASSEAFAQPSPAETEARGTPGELEAINALEKDEYIRARKLAEAILKEHPDSIPALFVLGSVHHYGESNLPRALHLIQKAHKTLDDAYGGRPQGAVPIYWYLRVLTEQVYVTGSMDLREDQLKVLRKRDKIFDPRPADHIWPLIKLERWDEARKYILRAEAHEDINQQFRAMNGLCALEFEMRRRVPAYEACKLMAETFVTNEVAWSNTAESALAVFNHNEAEQFYLKATTLRNNSYGSPWRSLGMIYLAEGRAAETLSSLKKAQKQRMARASHTLQQDQASMDTAVTSMMLALGRSEDAERMARKVYERPDRAGSTSASRSLLQITGSLLFWSALQMKIAESEERRAALPWYKRLVPDTERQKMQVEAWTVERRAVRLMASNPELGEIIRPYLTGTANLEVWQTNAMIGVLGPGVTKTLLRKAREEENHPDARGYFDAIETEIALQQGDEERALVLAQKAQQTLPPAEVMLRARVAALGGQAAHKLGQTQTRDTLWNQALEDFPAIFRLLNLSIPVRASYDTDLAEDIADALLRSPRFHNEDAGLSIHVEDQGDKIKICLTRRLNSLHGCSITRTTAEEQDQEDPGEDEVISAASNDFHDLVMSPKLDLSQADVRSLDGSPTVGRARKEVDDLLKEVQAP